MLWTPTMDAVVDILDRTNIKICNIDRDLSRDAIIELKLTVYHIMSIGIAQDVN